MGSMSDATENHDDVPGWGDADPEAFERLARIWDALGCGPLWLERSTPDPLFDPLTRRALLGEKPQPSVAPVVSSAPATSQPAPAPRFGRPTQAAGAPAPQHPRAPQNAWGTQSASQPVPQTYQPHQTPQAAPAYIPVLPEGTNAKIRTADWATLEGLVRGCTACPMSKTRQNPVFAEGAPGPKLVLVGEAPGAEEDLQGIPFVGKSGKLLTAMLDAIAVRRKEDVVILNALKCRPPQNRNPEPAETACCSHYLERQFELLKPDVLFLMGRFAVQAVLKERAAAISRLRGVVHETELSDGRKVKCVVTYHPSYLLRSPGEKAKAWEDLVLLRRTMREAGISVRERGKTW